MTVGSNQSDAVPKAAVQSYMDAFQKANPGLTVKINTIDHNSFQENINNYLQGSPDDVFTWFAGLPDAVLRRARASPATSPTSGRTSAGMSRRPQEGLDRRRRQAVLRAVDLLPVGRLLPQERLRRRRATQVAQDPRRVQDPRRPDEEGRSGPDRLRRQGRLARDGHLRPAQPARQRLRLPRQPDGRQGGLERRQGQGGLRHLGRACSTCTSPTRSAAPGRRRRRRCSRRRRAPTSSASFVAQQFEKGAEQDDLDFFNFPEVDSAIGADADRGAHRRLHDGQAAQERGRRQEAARATSARPTRRTSRSRPTPASSPRTTRPTRRPTPPCRRSRPSS